jgi:hypothetical protein
MESKKLKGSISFDDFLKGLLSGGSCKTFGEVWEKCVNCSCCEHREACERFAEEHYEVRCSQFIDMLLGNISIKETE